MEEIDAKLIFGNSLKKIRTSRKLTLREFASLVGFSHVYISDIEKGNRKPTLEMINRFCNTLILKDEEKKSLNIGYAYAHPEVSIPSDILYYILENNLIDTMKALTKLDETGEKTKKFVLSINKN